MYGYDIPAEIVEFVALTVTAVGPTTDPRLPKLAKRSDEARKGSRQVYFRFVGWVEAPVYERDLLGAEASVQGPAVVEEPMATTLVHPGHSLRVDDYGNCLLAGRHEMMSVRR